MCILKISVGAVSRMEGHEEKQEGQYGGCCHCPGKSAQRGLAGEMVIKCLSRSYLFPPLQLSLVSISGIIVTVLILLICLKPDLKN